MRAPAIASVVTLAMHSTLAARVARADEPPAEVLARGTKAREPARISLPIEEARKVPGAFGDPIRVIDALPGAVPYEAGSPYPVIRGAPPGNTSTTIDGITVPLLYHLGFGPAVVHPELISRVDYFAGSAPARFGRAVGGAVATTTREPEKRPRAYAQVRAFDAGALVESPFAGGKADALVAGRYSYTAAALSLFSPGVDLDYWDYQGRAGVALGEHDRVSVFAFGSHDRRGVLSAFGKTTFASDFHRLDLRYDRALGPGDRARLAITLGDDNSANEQASVQGRLLRVRAEIETTLDETLRLRAGADGGVTWTGAARSKDARLDGAIAALYPEHADLTTGAYTDLVWRPVRRVEIVPGARVDLYDWRLPAPPSPEVSRSRATTTAATLEPRLGARFTIHRGVAITSTIGLFHQPPSFFVPIPGLQPANFSRGLQRSLHRSAGIEVDLPGDVVASTTGFWHENDNLTSFTRCTIPAGGFDLTSECIARRSRGRAYGVELLVRRPLTKRLGGWIAYTLSRTTEEGTSVDPRTLIIRRQEGPTAFDHTHVLNVVASYGLGRRWNAGARLLYYSGRPSQPGERVSGFTRLDLRLEKRWPLLSTGYIGVVFELLNATFSRAERPPAFLGQAPEQDPAVVLPNIGVEASL